MLDAEPSLHNCSDDNSRKNKFYKLASANLSLIFEELIQLKASHNNDTFRMSDVLNDFPTLIQVFKYVLSFWSDNKLVDGVAWVSGVVEVVAVVVLLTHSLRVKKKPKQPKIAACTSITS